MNVLPDNHRKQWTESENNTLKNEIKCKLPFHIIAKNHKRTIGAIKYRLIRNAIAEINSVKNEFSGDINISIEYLLTITNLSKCELSEGFKKLKCNYDVNNTTSIISIDSNKKNIICNWFINIFLVIISWLIIYFISVILLFEINRL